jgi:hypothetical protein
MTPITRILALAFLASLPARLDAQVPGTRVTIDVNITSLVLLGDTAQITYVLYSRPESQDSLLAFIIDAPARVSSISRPLPDSMWMVDSLIRGSEPAAFWGILSPLPPAASTVPLRFASVGIPGIVKNWAQGNWPLPTCCDDDPPEAAEDVLVTRTVEGKSVGVEPWPTDRSAQALLVRLRTLTQTSCASPLVWIADAGLCGQLQSDIDAAEAFRVSGANAQAQATLDHYKSLLSGPDPGTIAAGVKNPAYWLLTSNADIIKNAL